MKILSIVSLCALGALSAHAQIIIDHTCTDLSAIPESAINEARAQLHIAYGHTSHGSQLTTGMTGLIGQTNLVGYKGDIYRWNNGGDEGALDLHDYAMPGDLGHNGDLTWAANTRTYLDNLDNSDVNVIIWSWCGGVSDNTAAGIDTYLNAMNQLEIDYPDVAFVYMTGHLDIWNNTTLKANNQRIRDYCVANDKILYDFADIESYDPDGTYYRYAHDDCSYYDSRIRYQGNWAMAWQDANTEGVDWFDCDAAHSQPLNGNLKAYAAWWLWARLAGWEGTGEGEGEGEGPSGGCPAGTIGPPSSGALPGLRGDAIVLSLGFSAILVAGKRVAVVRHAPFHGRG